ncbi:MAG: methyltransferase domain-containing protein [Acidobacteria bacterium]|nr:methyltransferase domain-containing protein [Acidobacteriota bacterium]
MKSSSLRILCCPFCKDAVSLQESSHRDPISDGMLSCESCGRIFAIKDGIPRFIRPEELVGSNKKHEKLNNMFSHICTPATKLMFAVCGGEENARRECLDRLERRPNAKILEIGIGAGDNLPYLMKRLGGGEVFGLDISHSMLEYCSRNLVKWGLQPELFLGEAEHLPFKDEMFDVVYHLGAINFFTDKKRAIEEMIRVAKPGTKIVIADESEKALKALDKLLLQVWIGKREEVVPPIDLVPKTMLDIRLETIWKGYGYCIEFRTPLR